MIIKKTEKANLALPGSLDSCLEVCLLVLTYSIIAIYHMVIWSMQAFTKACVSLVRVSDCQTGS